jgi:hypothetical protein
MKNIHILPTTQPSRLVKIKDTFFITSSVDIPGGTFYNIYITSDEEIKQGDWFFDTTDNTLWRNISNEGMSKTLFPECEKIILTTNPKLIPDGVQSIDDEFLKWFVKNSSCESVEVNKKRHFEVDKSKRVNPLNGVYYLYKIIIPQELKSFIDFSDKFFGSNLKEEPKQETLEEAAERHYINCIPSDRHSFISGAKWQSERMYSEQIELINWLQQSLTAKKFYSTDAEDLIEQFKKK